jgi:hypothetical protein
MAFRTAGLQGRALFEHMRRVSSSEPTPCHHCGAVGCPCGQAEAREAVELATLLPRPSGSHLADVASEDMRRSIPLGPTWTLAQIEGLARGAEKMASYWRLALRDGEADGWEDVVRAAREAAAKMP